MVSVMEAAANTISSTGSASGTVSSGAAVSSVAGAAQAARPSTIAAAINNAKVLYRLSVDRADVKKAEELFFLTPELQKTL